MSEIDENGWLKNRDFAESFIKAQDTFEEGIMNDGLYLDESKSLNLAQEINDMRAELMDTIQGDSVSVNNSDLFKDIDNNAAMDEFTELNDDLYLDESKSFDLSQEVDDMRMELTEAIQGDDISITDTDLFSDIDNDVATDEFSEQSDVEEANGAGEKSKFQEMFDHAADWVDENLSKPIIGITDFASKSGLTKLIDNGEVFDTIIEVKDILKL